jgi:cytochrome c-type biogenesis protein
MPIEVSISAAAVFAQGILSFLSPCVLPLLPVYIGYLSGGTLQTCDFSAADNAKSIFDRRKVLLNTVFFVLGICFVFFMLGFGATQLGSFFVAHKRALSVAGGILVTLFGLVQLFLYGKTGFTGREHRIDYDISKLTMSPFTALLLGLTFSFAWTPCIGPVLSGVLVMAASAGTKAQGFLLIGLYTLGFILPFLAVGTFTTCLLDFFQKHRSVVKYTVTIGAVLMIAIGVLMITGLFSRLAGELALI